MFIPQMANHAAPWEDENGWTHNNCPVGYRFPEMLCNLSRYLGHPVVILFDSGASHSFISALCVVRNNLQCEHTGHEYFIQSPGGRLLTHATVRNLSLDLGGSTYFASPLVLHHQGID